MRPGRVWHWLPLIAIAGGVILLDQITKAYVVAHLGYRESWMPIEAIAPFFRFTHIRNTGAAFGLFPDGGVIFLIIALVVSAFILYFYRQIPRGQWLFRLALGMQLGGALGNAIDRVRQGYVVDFLHVEFWPVFNVADSAVVVGVLLFAFWMWREDRRAQAAQSEQAHEGRPDSSPERPHDEHTIYG